MVHFDFKLDDVDAENLFFMINESSNRLNVRILDEMAGDNNPAKIQHYREIIEYNNELKSKMTNTRCGEG